MTMDLVDMVRDEDDLSLIIKDILVKDNKTMTFHFIDGSEYIFDFSDNEMRKGLLYYEC